MSRKRVILVDDDESLRRTLFLMLHEQYRVYPVKNAREALRRFSNTKIDLIISDVKLPDLNGLEMIAGFREAGYRGEVILISGYPDIIDINELRHLSVGYFFAKPFDLAELSSAVEYLLDTKKWHEKRISSI
jgi:two-component system NtrC family response regulator